MSQSSPPTSGRDDDKPLGFHHPKEVPCCPLSAQHLRLMLQITYWPSGTLGTPLHRRFHPGNVQSFHCKIASPLVRDTSTLGTTHQHLYTAHFNYSIQYDFISGRIVMLVTSAVNGIIRALVTTSAISSGWRRSSGLYVLPSIAKIVSMRGVAVRPG
jgi:hypothetical protein